jgi:glyoxylase-like metal-dependent hydrolase (beta-lactamase superfamily II)
MKHFNRLRHPTLAAAAVAALLTAGALRVVAQGDGAAWTANLEDVRRVERTLPGRRPLRLNVLKFAESRRTKNFSVKGAAAEPSVQARTAFQLVYADGTVMIDAGMDQQVHDFFGRGVREPYDASAARDVERAIRSARLIVVTHEHGDHVAGVVRPPLAAEVASRTLLTRSQVQSLTTAPQMPEIRLSPADASRYLVVDYEKYLPVAPGLTAIRASGHTPGSQMLHVRLESGREVLLIGDTAWHMDGVRTATGKDAPWVVEDVEAVNAQLRWLSELSRQEKNLVIVASHDAEQHRELIEIGVLGGKLE